MDFMLDQDYKNNIYICSYIPSCQSIRQTCGFVTVFWHHNKLKDL